MIRLCLDEFVPTENGVMKCTSLLISVLGDYGLPQPWYFPVLESYWYGSKSPEAEKTATADGKFC